MDQQYPTIINATDEFNQKQISALQEAIEKKDAMIVSLQDRMSAMSQRSYADSAERNRMVESMKEWTLEALSSRDISETNAEEIAEIMGFELTQEIEVEVTVTYNMTLQVPHDEDAEDIVSNIDFETIQYNDDCITWLSASVDRIDI
jgi:predicted RNase H-like nuclease (RuvC/YqgF family)